MSNLNDIFGAVPSIEQPAQNFKLDEFNPSAKSSKTGTYTAIIKFIPWHVDPQKSIMSKTESYLTDPNTKQGKVVDSLKNFQQSCPIVDTFWALHNSGDASLQAFVKKHINTYTSHASIVQVIKDDVHPENNGKFLVWRYKKTIWDKLYNESHPQYGTNPQPFDIINGRYFAVNVSLKSGYNNYDNCQFINASSSGIYIADANGNFSQVDATTDRQTIYNYLVNNSPDLNKYAPKEWDEKTSIFVTTTLDNINRYAQAGTMSSNIAAVGGPLNTPPMGAINVTPQSPVSTNPVVTPAPTMPSFNNVSNPNTMSVTDLNNNFTTNQSPTPPQVPNITGVDLPPMPNIQAAPTAPVGLGLGLDDIVGNL